MQITACQIQYMMQDFYHKNRTLPNTLLLPPAATIETLAGFTVFQVEKLFYMKTVYAAVQEPTCALL